VAVFGEAVEGLICRLVPDVGLGVLVRVGDPGADRPAVIGKASVRTMYLLDVRERLVSARRGSGAAPLAFLG
jgi:hypothetical protein